MMASGLLWRRQALYIARPLITVWGIGGGVMDGIAVKRTLGFPLLFILGGNRKKNHCGVSWFGETRCIIREIFLGVDNLEEAGRRFSLALLLPPFKG